MKLPLLRTSVGAIVVATLIAATISPVFATAETPTLPVGESLFALGASNAGEAPYSQLFSVNASSAAGTPIGAGRVDAADIQHQSAWDAKTQTAYFLENSSPGSTLGTINVSTGVSTLAAMQTTLNANPITLNSIAINGDGEAFVTDNTSLYGIDLLTGEVTWIAYLNQPQYFSLDFDPTSDLMYAADINGYLFTVSTLGETTTIGYLTLSGGVHPLSLQVDSSGILWIAASSDGPEINLWTVDPHNSYAETLIGPLTSTETSAAFSTQSLLLMPTPITSPVITSTNSYQVSAGTAFTFAVTATGSPSLRYTVSSGTLPAGVTLDPATGALSGTATTAGKYIFTLSAINGGEPAFQSFTLTVVALPIVGG